MCFSDEKLILIDSSQPRKFQEITLVHEVLHALWSYYLKGEVSDDVEERIVEGLDEGVHELLKQIRS